MRNFKLICVIIAAASAFCGFFAGRHYSLRQPGTVHCESPLELRAFVQVGDQVFLEIALPDGVGDKLTLETFDTKSFSATSSVITPVQTNPFSASLGPLSEETKKLLERVKTKPETSRTAKSVTYGFTVPSPAKPHSVVSHVHLPRN